MRALLCLLLVAWLLPAQAVIEIYDFDTPEKEADYKKLIEQHEVDLLLLHTKDEDQLAMHGLAYPVTVELRDIPLLLI